MSTNPANIRSIFDQVVDLQPTERAAALGRLCGDDTSLRAELDALLASHDAARVGGFMTSPTAATTVRSAAITEAPGSRVGPYKLLQVIGEGGFGTVFLAEQSEPVRRRVALKIIKLGMDTKQVIARFEAERQALALMDHPHIARVLDAGATPITEHGGGRPYFVMEYVVGDAITQFAANNNLDIRARLELFAQVCSAVQHAHTKGIIHRDIKPGNVLVTMTDGRPFARVIDFGIAKATSSAAGLTDKTLFTEHRQLIGTPEYMSPEQAQGSPDIDTRTDVYALGVLLYELLAGDTPFDGKRLRSAAWDEMRRIIKEEDPPTPSARVTQRMKIGGSASSPSAPSPLRPSAPIPPCPSVPSDLRGELDWIVMKSLDKDRARRYETPSALAADVLRHLKGEAVQAAPPSAAYRLRKFVRRNKGPVIAGSAVAATLLVGIAGTASGWITAQRKNDRLNEQERLSHQALSNGFGTVARFLDLGGPSAFTRDAMRPYTAHVNPSTSVAVFKQNGISDSQSPYVVLGIPSDLVDVAGLTLEDARQHEVPISTPIALEALNMGIASVSSMLYVRSQELETANAALRKQAALVRAEAQRLVSDVSGVPWSDTERYPPTNKDGYVIGPSGPATLWAEVDDNGNVLSWGSETVTEPKDDFGTQFEQVSSIARRSIVGLKATTADLTAQTEAAEWSAYTANLALAQAAMDAGNWPEARERLAQCPESKRGWEWEFFRLRSESVVMSLQDEQVCDAALTDNENEIVVTSYVRDVPARLVDIASGRKVDHIPSVVGTDLSEQKGPSGEMLNSLRGRLDLTSVEARDPPLTPLSDLPSWFSADGRRVAYIVDTRRVHVASVDGTTPDVVVRPYIDDNYDVFIRSAVLSPDGNRLLTLTNLGTLELWDANSGMHFGTVRPPTYPMFATFDRTSTRLITFGDEAGWGSTGLSVVPLAAHAGPETYLSRDDDHLALRIAPLGGRTADHATPTLSIDTPDGTRHIKSDGRALRFIDAASDREVAVVTMANPVVNLEMIGDGTRLIIYLADGSARIWDIRDPSERLKDAEAKWAERVPAGAYLDTLLAGPTPTTELENAVISDSSLTPLRRLVAAEMLQERLAEIDWAAETTFANIMREAEIATDAWKMVDTKAIKVHIKAAAVAMKPSDALPPRAIEMVIARTADWEYIPSEPSTEDRLDEEEKKRRLAEADVAVRSVDAAAGDQQAAIDRTAVLDAIRTYRDLRVTHDESRYQAVVAALATVNTKEVRYVWAESALRAGDLSYALNLILEAPRDRLNPVAGPNESANTPESVDSAWTKATPCELAILAMVRFKLMTAMPESVAAAARVDQRILGSTMNPDELKAAARSALSRAREIMSDPSALDDTGRPWSENPDAQALLKEAEELIEREIQDERE